MRWPTAAEVQRAALDALAVLLPIECAGCGVDDRTVCDACRVALRPTVIRRRVGSSGGVGLPVWAGLDYDGVARETILALKTRQRSDVAWRLAHALSAAARQAVDEVGDPVQLIAIPGTRAAYRRRGYDPVRLMVSRAGLRAIRGFAPARPHAAQKGLAVGQRARNLRGVFRLRSPVAGLRILLIDDVVTTGATLLEAARVLTDGGAQVVGAAVVASTRRRVAVGE